MGTAEVLQGDVDLEDLSSKQLDRLIPQLAKEPDFVSWRESELATIPTTHRIKLGDARDLSDIADESVHLIVTSPPYWSLKDYNQVDGQLGHIGDYQAFHRELNEVWEECLRILVPGGRLVVVVGDVVVSRRSPIGRHKNFPLHADIQVNCEERGFDNLTPIFWIKIANATFEANGNGGGFLGKPYEPGAIIKNDSEFILMLRKPGGYRSPSLQSRLLSVISEEEHKQWFGQVWTDIPGASTADHPAPYPAELAERLIRMFSFAGDTVVDPFVGTGSTLVAALRSGRNSIGIDVDPEYLEDAKCRLEQQNATLSASRTLVVEGF